MNKKTTVLEDLRQIFREIHTVGQRIVVGQKMGHESIEYRATMQSLQDALVSIDSASANEATRASKAKKEATAMNEGTEQQPMEQWQHLELVDADGDTITDESYKIDKLREYRTTGGMHGVFFAGVNWDIGPGDVGPAVDWTGFPKED